ncbi:MAG: hypothetical protein LBU73_00380 [Helicobacteraceae bacterium]|nr:hypothetical protein [Helicobacteraceae bacterium]
MNLFSPEDNEAEIDRKSESIFDVYKYLTKKFLVLFLIGLLAIPFVAFFPEPGWLVKAFFMLIMFPVAIISIILMLFIPFFIFFTSLYAIVFTIIKRRKEKMKKYFYYHIILLLVSGTIIFLLFAFVPSYDALSSFLNDQ